MGILDFFYDLTARIFDCDEVQASESIPASSHDGSSPLTPALPAEIVVSILESAYERDNSQKTLAACALVCRDWSVAAQKILYRRVSLASAPALDGFVYAVSQGTPRSRMLSETVQYLRLVLDAKQPRGIPCNAFAHAVARCPNLAELSLAVYDDSSKSDASPTQEPSKPASPLFSDETLSLLRTGPRVAALRFDNWSSNAHALAQLLEAFPALSALSVSGTAPALPSHALPAPRALHSLRLNFQTSPSLEFVKWLVQDSSLRALEFARMPDCESLMHLLLEHCGSLESLALPSCAAADYVLALAQCTSLRELRIEDLWTAPNVRLQLPPSLECIAFALDKRSALGPVVDAVKKSASLSRVAMHVWAEGAQHSLLPDLRIACAMQGVELDVVQGIHEFRAL